MYNSFGLVIEKKTFKQIVTIKFFKCSYWFTNQKKRSVVHTLLKAIIFQR